MVLHLYIELIFHIPILIHPKFPQIDFHNLNCEENHVIELNSEKKKQKPSTFLKLEKMLLDLHRTQFLSKCAEK